MDKIRQLKYENLDEVMLLLKEATQKMISQGIDQWDTIYPDRQVIIEDIGGKCAYGYFEDKQLSGYVVVNEMYSSEYDQLTWSTQKGEFLVTHRLTVKPDQQGKGIAKQLMNFVADHAKRLGYRSIRLDAFSKNPGALHLYEQLGYTKRGMVQFRKGAFICFEYEL